MKIALVGPTYPFRGGISHYTTLLYVHLKEKHEVRFYTFNRQYPKILYPGDASYDSSRMRLSNADAIPSVDWTDPFSWFKTASIITQWSPDLVIFPWWMWGWAIPFYTIGKIVSLKSSARILYICHNVVEHETSRGKRELSKFVLSIGDCFIVHCQQDYENLKKMFPNARIVVNCHPTYKVFNQNSISKKEARKKLGIADEFKKILLFFGIVRPYKGLAYLIEAMPRIVNEMPDTFLLVVGEFWENKDRYLQRINEIGIEDNVKVIGRYIPNEDVGIFFSAADVVVLPYVSGTGSGIVQLAFGFHKPVIATKVGCIPEVVNDGKTGLVVERMDPFAIASAVISFYKQDMQDGFKKNIVVDKEKFSWNRLRESIEAFLE
jgi:glycosyltransferase involved in cell wall biosynthesis